MCIAVIATKLGAGILEFATASRQDLGATQPPIEWVPGALSLGVKRLGREVNHSHLVPRSRMHGTIPPFPRYTFIAWCSVKTWGQLHLYFTFNNSMEQSPSWEANSHSASQEFLHFYGTSSFSTVFKRARHWSLP
jgi:hypothetical protein